MSGPPSMFESPSQAQTAPLPNDNYVQPNLAHGLRIWWAFYWPTTLAGGFLAVVLNFWLRRLYQNLVLPANVVGPVLKVSPYVISYTVAFFVMHYILRKNFRHFRLGLLSNGGREGAEHLPPTLARTLRVWWTYSWRTLFYGAVAWVVVIMPLSWFLGLFKPSPVFATLFFGAVGLIIAGAVGLFAIYSNILDEDFGGFRVCVLPLQPEAVPQPTPAATPISS
ncbi:MAG: hypothetical protein WAL95_08580 [Candidatus Acidiferrales bacterium]